MAMQHRNYSSFLFCEFYFFCVFIILKHSLKMLLIYLFILIRTKLQFLNNFSNLV